MVMMMMPTMVLHDPIIHEMGDMMHDALYTATLRIFCHTFALFKDCKSAEIDSVSPMLFW